MSDRVTISNLMLGAIGCAVRITNPDDDTKEAAEIRAIWDETRREALRAGKYNFSIRRKALPALAAIDAPADEIYPYARAFQIPSEALRFVDVIDQVDPCSYVVEGGRILTNLAAPLRVRIVVDKPDCTLWDESFVAAYVQLGGFKIADNLTGDRGRKLDCWNAWTKLNGTAGAIDAVENPQLEHGESSWIEARFR